MHSLPRQRQTFYIVLTAVFFIHATFLLMRFGHQFKSALGLKSEAIKVKLVQEALKDIASNRMRQIVQSEDSNSEEKREDAFLSDKDRSFDRHTVARNVDTFKKAAKGSAEAASFSQKTESVKKKGSHKDLKLSDFGLTAGEPTPKSSNRAPASTQLKGLENGDPQSQGLSATNDYVQEVALGDFTHMNTVEYKFYGFYHRIRQKLEQFWGKSIQEKAQSIFRAGRKIASADYVTNLQVTLNEKGEIIAVQILGASGMKELDDAAVESFNEAGPFPNPPKEMLINGRATINWGFVVKS